MTSYITTQLEGFGIVSVIVQGDEVLAVAPGVASYTSKPYNTLIQYP